jgi:hypothetical protein
MKRLYFTLVSLFWLPLYLNAQTVWYVNHAASEEADGSSWKHAFTDFQEALVVASYGDQIWLAQGTYYPTSTEDRTIHFHLPKGVSLYGGFQGDETILEERNWKSYTTILSGNIGDPASDEDNSYTVLYMDFADHNNVIDGLTIRDGNANASGWQYSNNSGGPPYLLENTGGGMHVSLQNGWENEANFKIRNCTFEYNKASNHGGAVNIRGSSGSYSSPEFTNVSFVNNSTSWTTLHYCANTYQGLFLMDGCLFENNHSTWVNPNSGYFSPPALIVFDVDTLSASGNSILVKSTTFKSNTSIIGISGLGILTTKTSKPEHVIRIDSCQFIQNHSSWKLGALHIGLKNPGGGGHVPVEITNCLFLENTGDKETSALTIWKNANQISSNNYYSFVKNCDFIGNTTKGNNIVEVQTNNFKTYTEFHNCLFLENYSSNSSPGGRKILQTTGDIFLNNCVFQKNYRHTTSTTAFVATTMMESDQVRVNNCVFSKSSISQSAIRYGFFNSDEAGEFYLTNSIFYDLTYNPYKGIIERTANSKPGIAFIDNCLFDAPVLDHVGNSDFTTLGSNNWLGDNPMFMDWDADDLRLHPCSPWRNMGTNEPWEDEPNALDFAGLPRVQEGLVDLGAYEIQPINLQVDSMVPACFGETNAAVWLHPDYGCEQFEFFDEQGNLLTHPITGLSPGTFQVSVQDSLGRTDTLLVELGESTPLVALGQVGEASNASASDGYFEILSVQGGTPPYNFKWQDNGSSSLWRYDLMPGTYTLEMSDVHGCSEEFSWVIDFLTSSGTVPESNTEVVLYPNPALSGQEVSINSLESAMLGKWILLDAQGKRLNEGDSLSNSILRAPNSSGVYWLGVYVQSTKEVHWIKWVVLD